MDTLPTQSQLEKQLKEQMKEATELGAEWAKTDYIYDPKELEKHVGKAQGLSKQGCFVGSYQEYAYAKPHTKHEELKKTLDLLIIKQALKLAEKQTDDYDAAQHLYMAAMYHAHDLQTKVKLYEKAAEIAEKSTHGYKDTYTKEHFACICKELATSYSKELE